MMKNLNILLLGTALLLPACSFTEEALWPSLTGEDPAVSEEPVAQQAAAPAVEAENAPMPMNAGPPQLGTGVFEPQGVTPGTPTGTYVGKKVAEMRDELTKLQGAISQHNGQLQQIRSTAVQNSQRFHGTLAAVNARLQVGTTPGNPILVQQYNSALVDLDRIAADIAEMNKLSQAVAADSTMSGYLSESVSAAFRLSGAIDEDHRQLAILEDETSRTAVLIERLLKELSEDIRRQTIYVRGARGNLNTLASSIKSGEIFGDSLGGQVAGGGLAYGSQPMDTSNRRPLVVIRFDRANVPYQQSLYTAVSRVLESRPDATFDLVAVAPAGGGAAQVALNTGKSRRAAEGVMRSLVDMGLPPNRVVVSAKTSPAAQANEVHLYLR